MSIIDKSDDLARACLVLVKVIEDRDATGLARVCINRIVPALGAYIKARKAFSMELLDAQDVLRELQLNEDGVPFDAKRN